MRRTVRWDFRYFRKRPSPSLDGMAPSFREVEGAVRISLRDRRGGGGGGDRRCCCCCCCCVVPFWALGMLLKADRSGRKKGALFPVALVEEDEWEEVFMLLALICSQAVPEDRSYDLERFRRALNPSPIVTGRLRVADVLLEMLQFAGESRCGEETETFRWFRKTTMAQEMVWWVDERKVRNK